MSISYCDLCYEFIAEPCENIILPVGLSAVTEYTMVLTDNHGNTYVQTGFPDPSVPDSLWTVTVNNFPEGMFNEWSGTYEVHFHEGGAYDPEAATEPMTIKGVEYQCILIKFKKVTVISS
jgi:hypothetical protein